MESVVAHLLALLDLEPLERNLYRGRSPDDGWQRVFGGQVIAQSLVAAARTTDGRPPHSLHGYFMRPGDPSVPIIYEVDRIHEGRSFLTRQVHAIQHGAAIFSMTASFQTEEPGLDHAAPAPLDIPGPDEIPSEAEARASFLAAAPTNLRRFWAKDRPLELRPIDYKHYLSREPLDAAQHVWLRAKSGLPDDPLVHAAVLAYASDMTLLDTTLFPHGRSFFDRDIQMASLDHAIWFHRPFRVDDWLLYSQDSPNASGARGLARGQIFTADGRLVASTAQEGLIRVVTDRK